MGRRDARHGSRSARLLLWLPIALVLALLAAAGAAYELGGEPPDPRREPAEVTPPPGLDLPALTTPDPVASTATGAADPAKVRRAVARLLRDRDLGRHVLAEVTDLDGTVLYRSGSGEVTPASTLKLLTSAAALHVLGPEHTFATRVVSTGPRRVVLVGGGDPLLASERANADTYPRPADVVTLARRTAAALRADGRAAVRLGYDTSLFSGPDVSEHWPASYVPDGVVAPIQALWVDRGRAPSGYGHVADPALAAAERFAEALGRAGVRVLGAPRPAPAAAGADELARVTSPPLWQLVEHTLLVSDNEAAEVLARQVAVGTGATADFEGSAAAVLSTVHDLGVPTDGVTTYDGSGLSRENRVTTAALTGVLRVAGAADHPDLRAVLTGLPVAGFTGSLSYRFEDDRLDALGRGLVRAKTGTLTGVSGLAGTVTDRSGTPMLFAVVADRIRLPRTLGARAALDAVTSALAACACG